MFILFFFIERLLQNKLHNTPIIAPFSKKNTLERSLYPLPPNKRLLHAPRLLPIFQK